jgi:hypothetical protein
LTFETGKTVPSAIGREIADAKLPTRNCRREIADAKLPTRNCRREIADAKLPT